MCILLHPSSITTYSTLNGTGVPRIISLWQALAFGIHRLCTSVSPVSPLRKRYCTCTHDMTNAFRRSFSKSELEIAA